MLAQSSVEGQNVNLIRSRYVLAMLALVLLRPMCAAQTSDTSLGGDRQPFAPDMQPSRVFFGWPRQHYFEGDLWLPIHLVSRTRGLREATPLAGTRWTGRGWNLVFVPHFTFRQSDSKAVRSAPVLTPTFNPFLSSTRTASLSDPARAVKFSGSHHSSGRTGAARCGVCGSASDTTRTGRRDVSMPVRHERLTPRVRPSQPARDSMYVTAASRHITANWSSHRHIYSSTSNSPNDPRGLCEAA